MNLALDYIIYSTVNTSIRKAFKIKCWWNVFFKVTAGAHKLIGNNSNCCLEECYHAALWFCYMHYVYRDGPFGRCPWELLADFKTPACAMEDTVFQQATSQGRDLLTHTRIKKARHIIQGNFLNHNNITCTIIGVLGNLWSKDCDGKQLTCCLKHTDWIKVHILPYSVRTELAFILCVMLLKVADVQYVRTKQLCF